MVIIYGIRSCDRCRAALRWFSNSGVAHRFHDLREDGVDPGLLESWLAAVPPDTLLNKRSTTWRALPPARREAATEAEYSKLLQEMPTLIKRPVVVCDKRVLVGYDEAGWTALLAE
ncbi:MAG: Spx/MgsR family RNA polymerase-binding regulatory protein [Gammaproteobacteria bacterium]|jgi:arsenate reductase|nr:Spx/MgsR family RNA polymerase-binding regulatory protein [Gammaproteobacteria bacterium]